MEFYSNHFDKNTTDANMPPGFRFNPTDEELITCYLIRKVLDSYFTGKAIAEVDLNKCEPWELPQRANMGEKEWYFFSLLDRKYPTGLRTNRATEAGYWKATGKDREIFSSKTSALVGMRKTLVFYTGRAPKGEKSNWVMHEFRLAGNLAYNFLSRSSMHEWVISRVFQKTGTSVGLGGSTVGVGVGVGGGPSPSPSIGGGGKKIFIGGSNFHRSEVSSWSSSSVSVSLPPLLDSSHYASAYTNDLDGCYYDSNATSTEQVPCFSASSQSLLDLTPPASTVFGHSMNVSVSAFPSLRALHENLQLPFYYSSVAPMHVDRAMSNGHGSTSDYWNLSSLSTSADNQTQGSTELDSIWRF